MNNMSRSLTKSTALIKLIVFSLLVSSCSYFHPGHSHADPTQNYQREAGASNYGMMPSNGNQDRWNPGWTRRELWGPGMMGPMHSQRMARHWTFMHAGIPNEYRGQVNPLDSSKAVLKEGAKLYSLSCARCHGANGMGNGEAGKDLNPSPALLAYMIQMPMAVDEYMMWTISEGGVLFATDMPAFKEDLTETEIWKIISFLRAGFPSTDQISEMTR